MYKNRDVILIAGLSGVGKTHAIKKFMQETKSYVHVTAGSLLQKRMKIIDRDGLRKLHKSDVLTNQYLIVEQFKDELDSFKENLAVLFDIHMIIDNDKEIIEIPYEIFEQFFPSRLIFIYDEAEKIIDRRKSDPSRERPTRTISEIMKQQELSVELAQKYCRRLAISFIQICSGDTRALSKAVKMRL